MPARPLPPRPAGGPRERWNVEVTGTGGVLGVLAGTVVAVAVVASTATFLASRGEPSAATAPPPRPSATATATRIPAASAAAPKVPLAAEDLEVTGTTRSTVTLAWRDANAGRLRYVVLTDAGAATVAPQPAGTATSHVVTGLTAATDYCFTVATGTGAVTPVTTPICVRTRP